MTAADLHSDLQKLIDARFDAIDRVLMRAQISWFERRSIVGEVETQVFELLARRTPNPTQEDVIAVLDSLDPPVFQVQKGTQVVILPAGIKQGNLQLGVK